MTSRPEPGASLDALLDAVGRGESPPVEIVRAGLAELVDRVGEAVVRLLEVIDTGGTVGSAAADDAVRDVLELCGLAAGTAVSAPEEVRVAIGPRPGARCEVCDADRPDEHSHVADVDQRRLLCVCDACRLLLEGSATGRFRAVPDATATRLVAAASTPRWWDDLDIPVGLAFLVHRSASDDVAVLYPGPAGVAETARPLAALPPELVVAPDVEAVVVLAEGGRLDAWRVPVTVAYELSGRLRDEGSLGDPMAVARRLVAGLA